jgi:hypothetical protein
LAIHAPLTPSRTSTNGKTQQVEAPKDAMAAPMSGTSVVRGAGGFMKGW